MGLFLGKKPDDKTHPWSEAQIQMFIIQQSRRNNIFITGSMEQGQRSLGNGAKSKAMGMTAGMTDMLCWLPNGVVKCIELKRKDGVVSNVQKEIHEKLKNLGHTVEVVFADSPMDGWNKVKAYVEAGQNVEMA